MIKNSSVIKGIRRAIVKHYINEQKMQTIQKEREDILTALKCCLSYDGYSKCTSCPYRYLISDETPFDCSTELYNDTVRLLDSDLISTDLDKAIKDGK